MMIEKRLIPPFGWATFCDDIRYEEGHKVSLIGIYNGTMLIGGSFPVTLPKLGISVTYFESVDVLPKELEFRIVLPGEDIETALYRIPVNINDHVPAQKRPEAPYIVMSPQLIISQVAIKQDGLVSVRVIRDGELLKIGSLVVKSIANASVPNGCGGGNK